MIVAEIKGRTKVHKEVQRPIQSRSRSRQSVFSEAAALRGDGVTEAGIWKGFKWSTQT